MRAVADESGRRYLLLAGTGGDGLLRDGETGDLTRLPVDSLTVLDGSPLQAATAEVPDTLPAPLDRAPGDRGVGLVLELYLGGPRPVRTLLERTALCESDLHGLVGDLRAAGLVREATVAGRRGYGPTAAATGALDEVTG